MSLLLKRIDFIQTTPSFKKEGKTIYRLSTTTKICPVCSNENLLLKPTLDEKTCTDCGLHFEWIREEGQKSLY